MEPSDQEYSLAKYLKELSRAFVGDSGVRCGAEMMGDRGPSLLFFFSSMGFITLIGTPLPKSQRVYAAEYQREGRPQLTFDYDTYGYYRTRSRWWS